MLPPNFKPMLATMAEPFDSAEFYYEIKWDGYRCLAFLDGETRLQSRNLKEISYLFPELSDIHRKFVKPGCILDGEVIALRNGKPSFLELQKRAQLKKAQHIQAMIQSIPVVYVVFDLLYLNYQPVFKNDLTTRRALLEQTITPENEIVLSGFIETKGISYFDSISQLGLEGVMAKKKDSSYLPGKRSKTWFKFKRKQLANFILCGYILNPENQRTIRSLILGAYLSGKLIFLGLVGTGFTMTELEVIQQTLEKIRTEISPFTEKTIKLKDTVWVRPLIVCEIEYLELTDEGVLRHPSFKRFRPEIPPADCQFEG
jgi:DNA ligase D-like protein (predicted ligase)